VFVRWENLTVEHETGARLPGFRDPAAVRTFDAPEALGIRFYEVNARSAINEVPKRSRMPFRYTINPYRGCSHACTYCFARPTHTYLDFNAREDFEREIVVKVNLPERVRAELGRPSWKGDHVALGTNTDPYQWVEGRYRLTEGVWEAMRDFANPCSVLTKSPLLLRDLKLFRELAERTDFVANLSIPTLDEKAWRATEPHTPHPRKRIEAAGELVRNGIPTGADRAADAGDQRRAAAGRADPRAAPRGRRRQRQRDRPAPAGRGARDLVRLAAPVPARPRRRVRAAVHARRLPPQGRGGTTLGDGAWAREAAAASPDAAQAPGGHSLGQGGAGDGNAADALLSDRATATVPTEATAATANAAS
jgi:hypothetical protein